MVPPVSFDVVSGDVNGSENKGGGRFVNLGCGSRHHPTWLNIDRWVPDSSIQGHDLRKGIPLPDESADVIYHSHVLEHFDRDSGREFLRDCFRVLKPTGVVRVVVPDLEKIVSLYLKALQESVHGSQEWMRNYEWLMLEMYDQAVREKQGGGVTDYFRKGLIPNLDFVVERVGAVTVQRLTQALRRETGEQTQRRQKSMFPRILKRLLRIPVSAKEILCRTLLGPQDYHALEVGRFRQSGEVHKWMYDRFSLKELLQEVGFSHPHECLASESGIPGWKDFHLDTEPDGTSYKPDSLYMEAVKIESA